MISSIRLRRLVAASAIGAFFALGTGVARAQSLETLNSEISAAESQMSGAMNSDSQAQSVVEKLDNAEKTFAQLSSSAKVNKAQLQPAFDQLESMLARIHDWYAQKKDDCIDQIDNGGAQCDYTI